MRENAEMSASRAGLDKRRGKLRRCCYFAPLHLSTGRGRWGFEKEGTKLHLRLRAREGSLCTCKRRAVSGNNKKEKQEKGLRASLSRRWRSRGGATQTQTLRGRSFNPNPSIRVDACAKVEKLLEGGGACTANAMCAYSLSCRSKVRLDVKEGGGAWGGAHPANAMCAYSIVLTPR